MNHEDNLEREGVSIEESVLDEHQVDRIRDEIKALAPDEEIRARNGSIFAARNVLRLLPSLRSVVECELLTSCVNQLMGDKARPVRALFFDKNSAANWHVNWHQDLTIAVREKRRAEGFGAWTIKAGVPHVQPPILVLEKMLALRIHLDKTDESNGALRVIPGSHRFGRLSSDQIEQLTGTQPPKVCPVNLGGVLFMKPLLLHSSLSCQRPVHRRVFHIEFSAEELPAGLEWYG